MNDHNLGDGYCPACEAQRPEPADLQGPPVLPVHCPGCRCNESRDREYQPEPACNGPFGDEESCPVHGEEIKRARGKTQRPEPSADLLKKAQEISPCDKTFPDGNANIPCGTLGYKCRGCEVADRIAPALADERERCAKIADRYATRPEIAAAIRSQKG